MDRGGALPGCFRRGLWLRADRGVGGRGANSVRNHRQVHHATYSRKTGSISFISSTEWLHSLLPRFVKI